MSALGDDLIRAMEEAVAHIEGKDVPGLVVHIPSEIDVAAIRQTIGLSRAGFADWIGVPERTVKNWEEGRRVPQGPARVLLKVIYKEPDLVRQMLAE